MIESEIHLGRGVVPRELVERLDAIFSDVPGVDTVELGSLLMEMTGKTGTRQYASDHLEDVGKVTVMIDGEDVTKRCYFFDKVQGEVGLRPVTAPVEGNPRLTKIIGQPEIRRGVVVVTRKD